jgi:hypothetical protein
MLCIHFIAVPLVWYGPESAGVGWPSDMAVGDWPGGDPCPQIQPGKATWEGTKDSDILRRRGVQGRPRLLLRHCKRTTNNSSSKARS